MENPQSLDANSPEAQSRVRRFRPVIVWLVILAAFAAYGYLIKGQTDQIGLSEDFYRDLAIRGTITWAAPGVGVATCVTLGWLILAKVRSRHLKKGWAILFLAMSSLGSTISTPLVFVSAGDLFSIPPDGHSGLMQILYLTGVTLCFAVVAFGFFSLSVLCARTRRVDGHFNEEH